MEIPERWRERVIAAAQKNYREHDWCRFRVGIRKPNGEEITTEITAPNKIHAASQVSVLGEIIKIEPI